MAMSVFAREEAAAPFLNSAADVAGKDKVRLHASSHRLLNDPLGAVSVPCNNPSFHALTCRGFPALDVMCPGVAVGWGFWAIESPAFPHGGPSDFDF